jgi:hypothetical protein
MKNYLQELQDNINLLKINDKINSFRGNIFYFGAENYFKSFKSTGIGTPRYNYDHNLKLFMETTYLVYKKRVELELGHEPTAKDIIHYIDSNRYISSRSQIFSFVPLDMYNDVYFNKNTKIKGGIWENSKNRLVQITIPIKNVEKHDPIVSGPGEAIGYSSWNKVSSIEFLTNVSNFVKKPRRLTYPMNYDNFPHLWLHCYHIPPNKFSNIKYIKR